MITLSNFDGLVNMLDELEIGHAAPVTGRLQVQLRFLRTIIGWGNSWLYNPLYIRWVPKVETYVANAYAEMKQHYCGTRDSDQMRVTVRNLSMNLSMLEYQIWSCCREYTGKDGHYYASFRNAGNGELAIEDLLKQLVDPLLEIISRWNAQPLQVLQERLTFVRNCLVKYRSSASVEALNLVEMVFENSLFVSSLTLWGENEKTPLETLAADLLFKIQDAEPFLVLAFSKELKPNFSENQGGGSNLRSIEFEALGDAHNLRSYLKDAIEPGSGLALFQAERDHIEAVLRELWFLEDFLMHTIPHSAENFSENGVLKHQLTQITYFAKEVFSALHSISLRKTEDGITEKLNAVINDILNCINISKGEARLYFLPENSALQYPRTLNLYSVYNISLKLEDLLCSMADLIAPVKCEIETLLTDVRMLRSLLGNSLELQKNAKNEGIKQLVERVAIVSYKAEFHIDSITADNGPKWSHILWLSDVIDEFRLVKSEATQVCAVADDSPDEENVVSLTLNASFATLSLELEMHSLVEEEVVGYNDEMIRIRNRLDRGTKHLDIVSIVGMPGLGKTTLARELYKSQTVESYFHVRSWCCVSQVYTRRGLLLDLLDGIVELNCDKARRMSDQDLAELLCRSLKGRRYLIVLDDIWSIDAWEDLRLCFPDESNGSRILLTSRVHDVSLLAKPDSEPIYLRMFSKEESWVLLQKRVFRERSCPQQLLVIGVQIAEYCCGLPLSVVVVAGILKDVDETESQWNAIADSVRHHTFEEEKGIMGVLELSYRHLPDHLKPCFLYLGIFPEDKEISVKKLVSLWVAEGLILKIKGRNWEDVAESYLKDLINRSLVMVAKRKSSGGIKTFQLHDLLFYFCLIKGEEERFLLTLLGEVERFTCSYTNIPERLCIHADAEDIASWRPYNYPHARSLIFNATARDRGLIQFRHDFSFLTHSTKLVRVLDLAQFILERGFPVGIELLVHLTYLAVRGKMKAVPSSIVKLSKLETLLVKGLRGEVSVPGNIWNMRSLRHLHIRDLAYFESLEGGDDHALASAHIESIATPSLLVDGSMLEILARLPCLRKLRCIFYGWWDVSMGCRRFPALEVLGKLKSLKVIYYGKVQYPCGELTFPLNLKKLTLSKFRLPWSHISKIGSLPNLEVLKLLFKSFEGDTWDVTEEEFLSLKYLKLDSLDIARWNVSCYPFPCLEHLVVQSCKKLESIPPEIGEIPVLQKIEVHLCNREAAKSATIIHDQQLDMGYDLQVHIYPPLTVTEAISQE